MGSALPFEWTLNGNVGADFTINDLELHAHQHMRRRKVEQDTAESIGHASWVDSRQPI
jgi:hypothetical protein